MQLNIVSPKTFKAEREYILKFVFETFLGLPISLVFEEKDNIELSFLDKTLVVSDCFFGQLNENSTYILKKNIPNSVCWFEHHLLSEKNLPVFYGIPSLEVKQTKISCGIDLFAAIFFMITRWEEAAIKKTDQHDRFLSDESLSVKNGFLMRPIVNEMMEFIWNMLKELGYKGKRKVGKFQLVLSHDIDDILCWQTPLKFIKYFVKNLFKAPKYSLNSLWQYPLSFLLPKYDPYYTYDFLMDVSELANTKSHFFFMSGGETSFDNRYNIECKKAKIILNNIHKRGHSIGFHPSYNAYNSKCLFSNELNLINRVSPQDTLTGRQHYLRFSAPETWVVWDYHNMKWESTLCYVDKIGFRTGICCSYPVFDIYQRKQLLLEEMPVQIMDVTLFSYYEGTVEQKFEEVYKIAEIVRKYNGVLGLLWHNANLELPDWMEYKRCYEKFVRQSF